MNYFRQNSAIIALTAPAVAVIGAAVWQFAGDKSQQLSDLATSTEMSATSSAQATSTDQDPQPYEKQFATKEGGAGPNRFVSKKFDFTFQYPRKFSVSAFDDRGGHTVLVQRDDGETAVQIFITGWDEPSNAVTPERIKKDLPDLAIREPRKMSMAGDDTALTFVGESQQFGTTREVWFARRGNLYQIITSAGGQEFLADLLETWRFR